MKRKKKKSKFKMDMSGYLVVVMMLVGVFLMMSYGIGHVREVVAYSNSNVTTATIIDITSRRTTIRVDGRNQSATNLNVVF